MMQQVAVNRYKQVAAATLTPGELLLALYGGLFRFLRTARQLFEAGKRGAGAEMCSKAHAVVSELDLALDHDVHPELCANLTALYGFCLDRLVTASRKSSVESIDEVIRVLTPLREAWEIAVPQAIKEQGRADAGKKR
jgi:flagellar secretion chaperone FliS